MTGGSLQESTAGAAAGIAQGIEDAAQHPSRAEDCAGGGILEAGDQETAQERDVGLGEVGMGALGWRRRGWCLATGVSRGEFWARWILTAVEGEGVLILGGLLLCCVGDGILQTTGLARLAREDHVEEGDEEA